MVISRKGRLSKFDKIQETIKNAKNVKEVYLMLERFNLSSSEERKIAQDWARIEEMKADHGVGVYAPVVTA
jgi:hypothetical protein